MLEMLKIECILNNYVSQRNKFLILRITIWDFLTSDVYITNLPKPNPKNLKYILFFLNLKKKYFKDEDIHENRGCYQQTDGQNNYRIDAHLLEESSQKL